MRRLTFSVKQASKRADEAEKQAKEKGNASNYARRSTAAAQELVRSGKYGNASRVAQPSAPTNIYNAGVRQYTANRNRNATLNSYYARANPNYNATAKANARWIGSSSAPSYSSLRPNMQKTAPFLTKLAAYNAATYGPRKGGRRKTRGGRKTRRRSGRKTRRAL